jgi:hypothetical protein
MTTSRLFGIDAFPVRYLPRSGVCGQILGYDGDHFAQGRVGREGQVDEAGAELGFEVEHDFHDMQRIDPEVAQPGTLAKLGDIESETLMQTGLDPAQDIPIVHYDVGPYAVGINETREFLDWNSYHK